MKHNILALGRLKTGAMNNPISHERLRSVLDYNPETGLFTRVVRSGAKMPGDVAGTRHTHGYVQICQDGRLYLAHRLAWLWMTGSFPSNEIDHINGVKDDNRFANLRDVAKSVNLENITRPRRNGTSGFLGVSPARRGWQAKIQVNGRTIWLGDYEDPAEAHQAYLTAKRSLHAGCTL